MRIIFLSLLITGCTLSQQKAEQYRELGEAAVNPDRREAHYERNGKGVNFWEKKCYGDQACKETFGE